ncbi:MAG: carboxypeptidase-like regulatory domain-containing protein [Planctomycetaceae bacterium]|jgi:hypothetical protein|nr:carboxypeptidase-like regulatory domain-containing protein [Planctomycetaceae bacterium]
MKYFIALTLLLLAAGCSPSANLSGLVPVSGTVVLDGVPLEGASLQFVPDTSTPQPPKRAGVAVTDTKGHFKAMTLQPQDGLYTGTYKVTVSKIEPYTQEQEKRLAEGKKVPPQKELAAEVYTNAALTPLTVTVGSKRQSVKLELQGE